MALELPGKAAATSIVVLIALAATAAFGLIALFEAQPVPFADVTCVPTRSRDVIGSPIDHDERVVDPAPASPVKWM